MTISLNKIMTEKLWQVLFWVLTALTSFLAYSTYEHSKAIEVLKKENSMMQKSMELMYTKELAGKDSDRINERLEDIKSSIHRIERSLENLK